MIFSFFKCCRCQASWEGQREAVSAWWQGEEVTLCKACVQYHFAPCQRMKIRMSVLLKQHNFIIFTINCILSSENLYVKAIITGIYHIYHFVSVIPSVTCLVHFHWVRAWMDIRLNWKFSICRHEGWQLDYNASHQALVIQKLDSAIHRINLYLPDWYKGNQYCTIQWIEI